ncbi:hypothetical protein SAMN05421877_10488 [Sphingobacterium lactis]|uniref:Uncharacterized protein n=1 Tax=Sphingobacterium lactis TaxID=797291 RepID=A0A1H5WLB8_9SPHI|nr:hypothetical protein SAMN05421877_10488 [Sphingobacterium lactis]
MAKKKNKISVVLFLALFDRTLGAVQKLGSSIS